MGRAKKIKEVKLLELLNAKAVVDRMRKATVPSLAFELAVWYGSLKTVLDAYEEQRKALIVERSTDGLKVDDDKLDEFQKAHFELLMDKTVQVEVFPLDGKDMGKYEFLTAEHAALLLPVMEV